MKRSRSIRPDVITTAAAPSAQARRRYLRALHTAMCAIAKLLNLEGSPTSHKGKIGDIEGIAHELAHHLEAGPAFEKRLSALCAKAANKHEEAALRIEVVSLERLGVHLSLQRLWEDANWENTAFCTYLPCAGYRQERARALQLLGATQTPKLPQAPKLSMSQAPKLRMSQAPKLSMPQAPTLALSARERRCVDKLVRIVEHALQGTS